MKEKYYPFHAEELKPLSDWLESQYLPYSDRKLHDVVNKIQRIVEEYELARQSGSSASGS